MWFSVPEEARSKSKKLFHDKNQSGIIYLYSMQAQEIYHILLEYGYLAINKKLKPKKKTKKKKK